LKIGLGMGLIICVLLPVVLLLFGIIDDPQTASAILLLAGLWTVAYGILLGKAGDRLYNVGFGIVVALASTFIFLPLQYVLGLVLISVIVIVLASVATSRKKT
jgi:hypothetical protein